MRAWSSFRAFQGLTMKKLLLTFSLLAGTASAGPPPAVGDKAPDFAAATHAGQARLADLLGKKHIILFFYPKDFTGG